MNKKPLQKHDTRVTAVEMSGDGESWESMSTSAFASNGGGLAQMIDLLENGERVFVRTKYVDIYSNGTNGLAKTGSVYELKLLEVQPLRQLIETTAKDVTKISDGAVENLKPGEVYRGSKIEDGR
jgi:hypothetical protein